jgi:hypothetical protein
VHPLNTYLDLISLFLFIKVSLIFGSITPRTSIDVQFRYKNIFSILFTTGLTGLGGSGAGFGFNAV